MRYYSRTLRFRNLKLFFIFLSPLLAKVEGLGVGLLKFPQKYLPGLRTRFDLLFQFFPNL